MTSEIRSRGASLLSLNKIHLKPSDVSSKLRVLLGHGIQVLLLVGVDLSPFTLLRVHLAINEPVLLEQLVIESVNLVSQLLLPAHTTAAHVQFSLQLGDSASELGGLSLVAVGGLIAS